MKFVRPISMISKQWAITLRKKKKSNVGKLTRKRLLVKESRTGTPKSTLCTVIGNTLELRTYMRSQIPHHTTKQSMVRDRHIFFAHITAFFGVVVVIKLDFFFPVVTVRRPCILITF